MSGIFVGGVPYFNGPILNVYSVGGSATFTETIPSGATNVEIQVWGGGGGNGINNGTTLGGGGGGGGAYSRVTLAVVGQGGKTITYSVGTGPVANSTDGASSQVDAGSVTGLTRIRCAPGGQGAPGSIGGQGGVGGTATNTNAGAFNQVGINGGDAPGGGGQGGTGATGRTGNVTGDGSPYGGGRHGVLGVGTQTGQDGAVSFYYT